MTAVLLRFPTREAVAARPLPSGGAARVVPLRPASNPDSLGAGILFGSGEPASDLEVAEWCQRVGWDCLTENQRRFIATICVTLQERPLTERQSEWLCALVEKIAASKTEAQA